MFDKVLTRLSKGKYSVEIASVVLFVVLMVVTIVSV